MAVKQFQNNCLRTQLHLFFIFSIFIIAFNLPALFTILQQRCHRENKEKNQIQAQIPERRIRIRRFAELLIVAGQYHDF